MPFAQMEAAALDFLARHLELGYYAEGTVIIDPAQGVPAAFYIIQRGSVQVVPFPGMQGTRAQPLNLGAGESFSVGALLERRAVTSPYLATADTFCYELPAAHFPELLQRSPVFAAFATRYLASMLRESRRLIRMGSSSAEEQQAMSRPLASLIGRSAVTCPPQTPVGDVLKTMQDRKVGSMLVVDGAGALLGIFTRHDVLDRIALARCDLAQPISSVMTPNPLTLPAEASAWEAALLIASRGIRHVPVHDGARVIGVVTERDLFALQRVSVRAIHRTVADAASVDELRHASDDIRRLGRSLLGQGVAAEQLTLIISTLNDALTRRLLEIESRRFDLHGVRWCWLAFGSEGRYEQTISTDQDNGLVFEGDAAPDDLRQRLLPLAQAVNRGLDSCGFPLCKGNIMAGNPRWCLSLEEWRQQFGRWVADTDPQALLHAVIFFDFRALHGEEALARSLRAHLLDLTRNNSRFQRQLAQYALETPPPLGLLSDFVTEDEGEFRGTIDLKKSGARLFADAARVLALAAGVAHTNTAQRLRQAGPALNIPASEIDGIVDGFFFLQGLRLRAQMDMGPAAAGVNRIRPDHLNEVDRRILKESLRQARKLQSRLALDYRL
ncbi:MAG: CBS domain-containing protein [Burkholderiales bacterium]|jgi:CBS domain-containing protein|nr:CBS domain-containing protein [Burkholderiales bacterium]